MMEPSSAAHIDAIVYVSGVDRLWFSATNSSEKSCVSSAHSIATAATTAPPSTSHVYCRPARCRSGRLRRRPTPIVSTPSTAPVSPSATPAVPSAALIARSLFAHLFVGTLQAIGAVLGGVL